MDPRHDHRKTALFWTITILLVVAVNVYFARHPLYRNQAREIDANYARLSASLAWSRAEHRDLTLIAGNSCVAAALVNGETFPPDIGRFVTGGLPLPTLVEMVAQLPDDARVELLVIGLSYNYAVPAASGSAMHRPYWSDDRFRRAFYRLPLLRASDETSEMVRFSLTRKFRRERRHGDGAMADAGATAGENDADALLTADHRRDVLASIDEYHRQYLPFTGQVSAAFIDNIARLRAICARRGVRLETFTAPIHADVRDRLDPAVLADFRAAIATAGIRHVDLNLIFADWDESHFLDATHLSPIGRRTVREYLRTHIASASPADVPPLW